MYVCWTPGYVRKTFQISHLRYTYTRDEYFIPSMKSLCVGLQIPNLELKYRSGNQNHPRECENNYTFSICTYVAIYVYCYVRSLNNYLSLVLTCTKLQLSFCNAVRIYNYLQTLNIKYAQVHPLTLQHVVSAFNIYLTTLLN